VIGLATDLGLRSIAEGVETPAQLDRLRVLRCDEAQGDLLALLMPVASLPSATDVKLRSLIKRIS
jgi:EAL domain-containing protein (putative c-di-GMP-specific phosphodiesterase class I)